MDGDISLLCFILVVAHCDGSFEDEPIIQSAILAYGHDYRRVEKPWMCWFDSFDKNLVEKYWKYKWHNQCTVYVFIVSAVMAILMMK